MASNRSRARQLDRSVQISKEMSRLLRHKPPPGSMDEQGFVAVSVLMEYMKSKPTLQELKQVIQENDKKRFVLDESSGSLRVRAAQGHSVPLQSPVLQAVLDASAVKCAIHATSSDSWNAIQGSGELRKMSRTHIHFATKPQLLRANKWATVLLKLKLQEAMDAGHQFCLSYNDVLLCEGPLPVQFVEMITQQQLDELWSADASGE